MIMPPPAAAPVADVSAVNKIPIKFPPEYKYYAFNSQSKKYNTQSCL